MPVPPPLGLDTCSFMSAGNKEMKSSSKAGTEPLKSFFDLFFFFLMTGAELEGNLRQAQSNFLKQPQL